LFTPEDERDELERELGRARRNLHSLERAPSEGRWTRDAVAWMDAVGAAQQRIRVLDHDLAVLRTSMTNLGGNPT